MFSLSALADFPELWLTDFHKLYLPSNTAIVPKIGSWGSISRSENAPQYEESFMTSQMKCTSKIAQWGLILHPKGHAIQWCKSFYRP